MADWSPRQTRFGRWTSRPRVAGWFFAVAGAVCAVVAVVTYVDATTLRRRGVETTGFIVGYEDRARESYVTVEFETRDGRTVTADVGNFRWSPRPEVGSAARIIYDPEDPEGLVADARKGPDFFKAWGAGAGAVISAVLSRLTFTKRIDWNRM